MFFMGGGGALGGPFCGQYPRAAKNPLKTPPLFKFGSGGRFKHDIRFPRILPPLVPQNSSLRMVYKDVRLFCHAMC